MENRWHVARRMSALALAGCLALGAAGCAQAASPASSESPEAASSESASESASSASESSGSSSGTVTVTAIDESLYDLDYTDRDKDPSYDAAAAVKIELAGATSAAGGAGVEAGGSTVTVTEAGVYLVSGELEGQIVVDAPEDAKVQLVLDGADIANPTGSAIYVKQADKCFITLAAKSENSLSDGADYAFAEGEDEPDAVLFSTCDLTLQGTGSLSVRASYNDGVKTKDDLVITGGTYVVDALGDGFVGKDSVKVADGDITVKTAEGDGIKSSKDTKETKGFVSIDGGTIAIDAADKGVKAETYLRIAGGGLAVKAADDALHCDGCGRILGGTVVLSAGDDAFHADYQLVIDDGTLEIAQSYEGLEGQAITMNGGDVHIVASDDGVNASSPDSGSDEFGAQMPGDGGAHWGGFGQSGEADAGRSGSGEAGDASQGGPGDRGDAGRGGGMMMGADESCTLTINGGALVVEADGDGLDSNGAIVMNGGTVYVNGPTSSADGALDCGTTITSNGGTLIAVGSAGMAEGFTDGAQAFGQVNLSGQAGAELQVKDSAGNVIASFTPTKAYQNVVVTVEGMTEGRAYAVASGNSQVEFTASTEASQAGFGGMGGQRPDDMGGRRPDGQGGGMGGPQGDGQMPQGGPGMRR